MQLTFLVLTRNDLYTFSKDKQTQLPFPVEIIRYNEILNQAAFEKILNDAFPNITHHKIVLFLGDDALIQKTIPKTGSTNTTDEVKKFIEAVPFAPQTIETQLIDTSDSLHLFAVNGEVYKTIISVTEKFNSKILFVTPLSPFANFLEGQPISYHSLSKIAKKKHLLKTIDFYHPQTPSQKKNFSTPIHRTHLYAHYSWRSNRICGNAIY